MQTITADLIICGGGAAGLPAALQAARLGLDTVVVEDDRMIGGAAVDMGVQNFEGRPFMGIYKELIESMKRIDPEMNNYICFRKSTYRLAWEKLFRNQPVRFITGEKIKGVRRDGSRIVSVSSDHFVFCGKTFIDATGNGDIAFLAGCDYKMGRESCSEYGESEYFAPKKADDQIQTCTLLYAIKRIGGSETEPPVWATISKDEFLVWGPSVYCENPLNEQLLAEKTAIALNQLNSDAEKWLDRGYVISEIADKLGVRETRRFMGKYVLSHNDIIERKHFPDSIAAMRYPVDPWEKEGNPFHDEKKKMACETPYYEVPYRILLPRDIGNLFFSGRHVSATHVVNASLRVMGFCAATGQAAAVGSYLSLKHHCPNDKVDILRLRKILNDAGMTTCISDLPNEY